MTIQQIIKDLEELRNEYEENMKKATDMLIHQYWAGNTNGISQALKYLKYFNK